MLRSLPPIETLSIRVGRSCRCHRHPASTCRREVIVGLRVRHNTSRGALLAEADVDLLAGRARPEGDVDVALEVLPVVDDVMVTVGPGCGVSRLGHDLEAIRGKVS